MDKIPGYILGGSGFAAGELARLLYGHPSIELIGVLSTSQSGSPLRELHPHLATAYPDLTTISWHDLEKQDLRYKDLVVFSALPHGHSAGRIKQFLNAVSFERQYVVDLSADFRYETSREFESIYKIDHGAPELIKEFHSGIPELSSVNGHRYVSHPGCFTTAVSLAAAPMSKAGCIDSIHVSAVTGSTGSGREPKPTTHHPVRANNLYAYKPLEHRHRFEMQAIIESVTDRKPAVSFVPHSGPFARGIHATLFADNPKNISTTDVTDMLRDFYDSAPFVQIVDHPPKVKDVVGTNYCQIGGFADANTVVLFSVIDNLLKGASGGGLQWMNRILGLDETTGLTTPSLGWV